MKAERLSRNALPFGTVLNGVYTVEAELGHGGVGIVYRAKHRELGPVAIKEYLPTELVVRERQSVHPVNTDSEEFFKEGLGRFLDEAKQLIRFRTHPNIVSCRDFFRANGTAYLVMDLEEGMSLSELLQAREAEGRPFDETDMLTVMVPLLEGLDLVHAAGVLHRDIKPANILIRREDNRPVLIDFGAAKQEFAQHSKSLAPFSPGYAAIEQVAEGRLGTWTDMYGIGAMMWRMVAGGNRPYEPLHPVRVERRAHAKFRGEPDPMPSAQKLGKGRFSQHILGAIDQCLELRETDRVQECKELLQRLREAGKPALGIAEVPVKARQTAERQPISHTAPNSKERHKKAIPAKRRPSDKVTGRESVRYLAGVCVLFTLAGICILLLLASLVNLIGARQDAQDFPPGSPASNFEVVLPQEGPNGTDRIKELPTEHSANPGVASNASGNSPELRSVPSYAASNTNPNLTGREKSSAPSNDFFTRGSHADDVLRIQGTPTSINTYSRNEIWRYGSSTVEISLPDKRVTDWSNTSGNLKVEMQPGRNVTSANFFTRGSHADDVLKMQGTPTSINTYEALGKEIWRYGSSTVEISLPDKRVTDWSNTSGNLKVEMQPSRNATSESFFTRGSHADDVLRIQGTPTAINTYEALGKETWFYGFSTVEISLPGRHVITWSDNGNNLKVEMQPSRNATSESFFTRGSHADDVLRIQGTPTAINTYEALGKETWFYGFSTVEISLPGRHVITWSDNGNNLKVQMQPGRNVTSARFFTRGSHADDVLRIQGTPTSINTYSASRREVWWYGSSSVELSLPDKRVTDWSNSGNLKVQMQPGTTR